MFENICILFFLIIIVLFGLGELKNIYLKVELYIIFYYKIFIMKYKFCILI